MSYLQLSRIN